MQRCAVAMLVLCAGCKFSVDALHGIGPSDGNDLAVAADPGDLAVASSPDLTTADLTVAPPDLTPDPCAGAPALGSGNLAAQCVIGNPPTIDGNLADWPPLTQFVPMTKASSAQANGSWDILGIPNDANAAAQFFVRWDLKYLYFAIAITDDIRQTPNSTASALSNNDAFEIFVDGLHNRSNTYGTDDWQLVYSADGQKVAAQGTIVNWPSATSEAWSATSPAWTLEAAIPWSILGNSAVAPGRVVGFDLKLEDNDGTSRPDPNIRERDLIFYYNPASGNGGCTAPNCRTDVFGAVQLQGR